MIDRLNFYDLYGYLLPGLALLGALAYPFWLVAGYEIPAEWSSALTILVGAYVVGHVLYRLDRDAFRNWPLGGGPEPSHALLDTNDSRLSADFKTRLAALLRARYGLDVLDDAGAVDAVPRRRSEAFFLARSTLLQSKLGAYPEQFEGMYALMRGLSAVAIVACCHYLGWAAGRFVPETCQSALTVALLIGIAALAAPWYALRDRVFPPRWMFWLTAGLVALAGVLCASRFGPGTGISRDHVVMLAAAALGAACLARWLWKAYLDFTQHFALSVYREIYALLSQPPAAPPAKV